jgi:hypothetical protein
MGWVFPLALWLLLLMLLLLFARQRTPRRRVAVGNLYLWSQAASRETTSTSFSLRRHRLLILQCAIVAALVTAIARPLLPARAGYVGIVIDVSMSMGARDGETTRLDRAKERAIALSGSLPFGTRAHIWLAASDLVSLGTFARGDQALAAALGRVEATHATTDLADAIQRARARLPAAGRIYVITDTRPTSAANVSWFQVGAFVDNVAVTNLAARRQPSGEIELVVSASNYGASPHDADIAVTVDGVVLATRRLSVPARGVATASIDLPASVAGVATARLQVEDALAADDVRSVALPAVSRLRVLNLVANRYVEQALAADPNIVVATIPDAAASTTEVVVSSENATPATVPANAGLLVVTSTPRQDRPARPVTMAAAAHPVIASVNLDRLFVVPVDRGRSLDEGSVLARADGAPVLAAYDDGGRRVVELRADIDGTGLVLDPAFPLLMANAIEWLASSRHGPTTITAGEPLRLAKRADAEPLVIIAPDGRPLAVSEHADGFVSAVATAAGIYRVGRHVTAETIIVHPATAAESDLAITTDRHDAAVTIASLATGLETELTTAVLLVGLILLAVEWHQRHGDRRWR